MKVHQIQVGNMQNFTYIVEDEETSEAIIIDPSWDLVELEVVIKRNNLKIKYIVNTHHHFDHTLGNEAMAKSTNAKIIQHKASTLSHDVAVSEGDKIKFGNSELLVIHTPGHSKGSISLLYRKDGALFTGDAVPKSGAVPIYEDVAISIQSIKRLKQIKDLEVLIASWDEPQFRASVYPFMDKGLQWFQQIHEAVLAETVGSDALKPEELSVRVLNRLGFPEIPLVPIIVTSIGAHLKLLDHQNIIEI